MAEVKNQKLATIPGGTFVRCGDGKIYLKLAIPLQFDGAYYLTIGIDDGVPHLSVESSWQAECDIMNRPTF